MDFFLLVHLTKKNYKSEKEETINDNIEHRINKRKFCILQMPNNKNYFKIRGEFVNPERAYKYSDRVDPFGRGYLSARRRDRNLNTSPPRRRSDTADRTWNRRWATENKQYYYQNYVR